MNDLFSKFSKIVDAVTDILTEDVSSTKNVALFRYSDLFTFISKMKQNFPTIHLCRVSLAVQNEFDGIIFPENKYVIRVLLLDKNENPICIEGKDDAYVGTVVVASSIDEKLNEFMKDSTERLVIVRGEK